MIHERVHESCLRDLLDREAISDTLIRYATAVDGRDWLLFRSCFTDPVEIDLSSWTGSPAGDVPTDDWVAGVRAGLSGFDVTHHMSSNHRIALTGDHATATSYVQARHGLRNPQADEIYTLAGYYEYRLQREPDGWRIRACRLTVTWSEGDRSLFDRARQRSAPAEERA